MNIEKNQVDKNTVDNDSTQENGNDDDGGDDDESVALSLNDLRIDFYEKVRFLDYFLCRILMSFFKHDLLKGRIKRCYLCLCERNNQGVSKG